MSDQDKTPTPPDDTEAHLRRPLADAESAEGDDNTEGHALKRANVESAEGDDDTEGHAMRPARG